MAGHDVVWTGDWPQDPGDREILAFGHEQQRCVITLDKDFGELAVVRGAPHFGILRLVNFRAAEQGRVCAKILANHGAQLTLGAIIVAEPGRLRIRRRIA